jgi:MSHA biogenesis protein MshO
MRRRSAGFTLLEIVIAMGISAVVLLFASLFVMAPLNAYQAQEQRAALAASGADVWPAMQRDLATALPNSIRVVRNGNFVAIEMLAVVAYARYKTPTGAAFAIAGTQGNEFPGVTLPFDSDQFYLSVNNQGDDVATTDAYHLGGAMTPAGTRIQIADSAVAGEASVTVNPAPVFTADSPRRLVYLVRGPVTWLCDEAGGTVRRYAGYAIDADQTRWDSAAEFALAGIGSDLFARGVTGCNAAVSLPNPDRSQTVTMTVTSANATSGDSVTLMHTSVAGYVP